MSYCPIDEAFGSFMTSGIQPNPLESSVYQGMESNNCQKKKKVKRNKINCNKNNSTFQNVDDMFIESPELTDSDMEFHDSIQSFSPYNNVDLMNINNSPPTKNKKSKLSKKVKRNNIGSNNTSQNIIEGFENNQNNSINIRRKNKSNKKKKIPVNEIYEYEPEETLPVNDLKYIHGLINENGIETDDSDADEETQPRLKATTSVNNQQKVIENNNGMNSQINEINNKINFIMNQISNRDNEITESQHNNIHDIILFVIFGIFVLIILESLYRLISKMVNANTILKYTPSESSNSLLEPVSKISSGNTFDVVRDYARNRK